MGNNSTDKNRSPKAEAFKRVAEKRTRRVLDSLRLLEQCSNRRIYEYTDEEVDKIFREIRAAVRRAEQSYKNNNRRNRNFKL